MFLLCTSILFARKDNILVPIIIAMCFFPADKSIEIVSLNFQAVRIITLVALSKIILSASYDKIETNIIDKLFIASHIYEATMYIFASNNTIGAFLYQGGNCIDSILLYIVFRYTVRSIKTLRLIIRTFCLCTVALLPFIIYEYFYTQNLFSFLGRATISSRGGEIRARGAFSHAILFGSYAAAIIPLVWVDFKIKKRLTNVLGLIACIFFVIASSCSGPIVALATAICMLFFFKYKSKSSLLAKVTLWSAIIIHFIREKPLWHFIYVRVALKSSSTGYYRYNLVEAAIKEFKGWWLWGYGDTGAKWHLKYWPGTNQTFTDVTNHYLAKGVLGGVLTMILFIILCFKGIKSTGLCAITNKNKQDQWVWWGYTVMLITHCMSFLSVAYFGQITMLLFLSFAVAAFAYDEINKTTATPKEIIS